MGALAPEAIEAAGLLAEDRRGVGVLAVTSADRLSAGWHGAQRAREHGAAERRWRTSRRCSPSCRAMPASSRSATAIPRRCRGSAASWATACARSASSTSASRARCRELYAHYGLDANAILAAAEGLSGGRVRYRRMGT